MNTPLASVIVPVYNVEHYLAKCVGSICGQTYPHLEVILVDDGSTDSSGAMCDRLAETDSRIRVIHKENGGVSSARNAGLDAATGTYVYFVDSDDWVMATMVEDTVPVMEQGGYDLCAWGMSIVQEGEEDVYSGRWKRTRFKFSAQTKKQRFLCRWVLPCRVGWSVYCRAFRRDIIQRFHLRFEVECTFFEDLDFLVRYLACCQDMYYIPKSLYAYRQHDASVMHTNGMEKQFVYMLSMVRKQSGALSDQLLFQPACLYVGTAISVLLWNFTQSEGGERGLVRAVHCLEEAEDWEYLQDQARQAMMNQGKILRVCGWRLGKQVCGFYHYILTRDPIPYCRAERMQKGFTTLRQWKNALLHR